MNRMEEGQSEIIRIQVLNHDKWSHNGLIEPDDGWDTL